MRLILSIFFILLSLLSCQEGENTIPKIKFMHPDLEKKAISKSKTKITTIISINPLDSQRYILGYQGYDSLGNTILIKKQYKRILFDYDSLNLLKKKTHITDFIQEFVVNNQFDSSNLKLTQNWCQNYIEAGNQSLNCIDTSVILFYENGLMKSKTGFLHDDKPSRRCYFDSQYFYDSLERVSQIVYSYTDYDNRSYMKNQLHNEWHILNLTPKVKENFIYKNNKLAQTDIIYTKNNSIIAKIQTFYNELGLKSKSIIKSKKLIPNEFTVNFFHSKVDSFNLLKTKK